MPWFSARMAMNTRLLLLIYFISFQVCFGETDPQDVEALQSLMDQWQSVPPTWGESDDPCSTPWEGVICSNSRIIALKLSTMSINGTLSANIGQLSQLQSVDLSFNIGLGGPLPSNIGKLEQLSALILAGCSFNGSIPEEIGSLPNLSFLALNSNQLSGQIPASVGNLSNLYWLDLADNQLTGHLPVSTGTSPGLNRLVNTKHFHFNKNKLSGTIQAKFFSSRMSLIHALFDGNNFTGTIPKTVGLVKSLEALRLDKNGFTGTVPSTIRNLTSLTELNLANNKLTGPLPNLTGMNNLNYVDLSNNSFNPSQAPSWFSTIQSLNTIVISSGGLTGKLPQTLFSLPQLHNVILDNNAFNGTLDMGNNISPQLQTVNLENNDITSYAIDSNFNSTLVLLGNPVCDTEITNNSYCSLKQKQLPPYSTSLASCGLNTCPQDQSLSPHSCSCAYPYSGVLVFRAPLFQDVTNSTLFQQLETSLWTGLGLIPGSVFLQDPSLDNDSYLQVKVKLFPPIGMSFKQSEVIRIGSDLSNQTFKPPSIFGPYYFIGSPYLLTISGVAGKKPTFIKSAVVGIAAGCSILGMILIGAGIYALKQKREAERASALSKPFASWMTSDKKIDGVPQLQGVRWFTLDELKRSTNNFSEINEIGSGGYGKVYRGKLPDGQIVAIKRAEQGSLQGALEFRTEIELLSRVHHKNVVSLLGFCFKQGEQMLVYEFISNGTLRDSLLARNGMHLDWIRRLKIALGSARGLAYLHELANPPIIHRDVKSTNILLDDNLNAKVADFGLSKLVADTEKGHVSTQVKGTLGYLDPEYYMTQQLTEKSDVYSFGVVMLELITAKQPIEKGKYIVRQMKLAMDDYYGLREITDPSIRSSGNLTSFKRFAELAMQCVAETAADRPTMNQIVKEIEMMLHNDGFNTKTNSMPSVATDFMKTTNNALRKTYDDMLHQRDPNFNTSSFDYSSEYTLSSTVVPQQ